VTDRIGIGSDLFKYREGVVFASFLVRERYGWEAMAVEDLLKLFVFLCQFLNLLILSCRESYTQTLIMPLYRL
jgi:hypothetical protein